MALFLAYFIVYGFFAGLGYGYPCGEPNCECNTAFMLTDCTDLGLKFMPTFTLSEVYEMKYVYLQYNFLVNINAKDFSNDIWLDLIYINLRENPLLNCSSLVNINPLIKVHADCSNENTTFSTVHDMTTTTTSGITHGETGLDSEQPTFSYGLTTEEVNTTTVKPSGKNQNKVLEIVLGCVISTLVISVLVAGVIYVKFCRRVQETPWERIRRTNPIYRPTTASNENSVFPSECGI
jgi:hypothetical protein